MKILLFGIAKDIVGNQSLDEAFQAKNVAELKQELIQKYPEFTKLSSLAVAVDEEYANDDTPISAQNEIAIIPPVSGG
ncbi:molybdopterin converting factor subunit 1 [Zunongwangia pacifica]|uniref:Molybdopterin synthase sulfur carrier subunit n=1 Tax=Zunongwangia pacifica TaxID=2911062 RepID=A0A9X1ZMI9_9FLAO|nr:molybdopterin converting factor subunit 1 [Zunongwangia pacifica]MCL6217482.1 molybdopterin converting factor subunit 1 [Zunongwangia pacifica]